MKSTKACPGFQSSLRVLELWSLQLAHYKSVVVISLQSMSMQHPFPPANHQDHANQPTRTLVQKTYHSMVLSSLSRITCQKSRRKAATTGNRGQGRQAIDHSASGLRSPSASFNDSIFLVSRAICSSRCLVFTSISLTYRMALEMISDFGIFVLCPSLRPTSLLVSTSV